MDPNNNSPQSNPQSGANPPSDQQLSAQQAANLIRQQIQSIHTGQDPAAVQQPVATSAPSPQPVVPPSEAQPIATPPLTQQTQPIPATPHYNPYHQATNPIVAANSTQTTPQQSASVPAPAMSPTLQTPEPSGTSYRKNYSTFSVPGIQQATPQEPQPVVASPNPPSPETAPMVVHAPGLDPNNPPAQVEPEKPTSVADLKERVVKRVQSADKKKVHHRLKPLLVSLAIGLIFVGINYNEVAVAQVKQYISPGDSISTPVILDPTNSADVGPESKIIIPKINLDVPVIYDIKGYDEAQIQNGLERGVVHYGTTALPGEKGNNVIVGHSSNNYFNSGEYKFAFVLLFRLEKDDTFILHYKGQRYIYKVFNKQVIDPGDFTLVQPTNKPVTTLITCTPPGTSWKRLVIQAEQISPDPTEAPKTESTGVPDDISTQVPGNAPSLWQRITQSIF